MKSYIVALLVISGSSSFAAQAALVTTNATFGPSTTTVFDASGPTGGSPQTQHGITVTGTSLYSSPYWGLAGNGEWDNFGLFGTNAPSGYVRFDLGGSTTAAGVFMNYAPGNGSPLIIALDASLNVLETYDLSTLAPISTPNMTNAGDFRGIQRAQGDIAYLQISNSFSIAHSLTVADTQVPEPAMLGLFGLGAVALGLGRRRKSA